MLEDTFFKKAKVRCWGGPAGRPPHAPASLPTALAWCAQAWCCAHHFHPLICTDVMLQAQGYVARSAYKLLEIQQKHKLIPPGGQVRPAGLLSLVAASSIGAARLARARTASMLPDCMAVLHVCLGTDPLTWAGQS